MTRKGGRVKICLASAMLTFFAMLPLVVSVYIDQMLFGLTEETRFAEYLLVYGFVIICGVLFLAPAGAAFFSYAYGAYSQARYGAVYRKRTPRGYFRNLFGGMMIFLRGAVCAVIFQGAYVLTVALEKLWGLDKFGLPMIIIGTPLMLLAFIICLIFCWLTGFVFLMPYYFARGEGLLTSFKKSCRAFIVQPFMKDGFALIFLPLILLSALTLGVLLIVFVMPLMMFTYFTLAETLDGGELLED